MVLDGKTFAESTMVVALGITLTGEKRFLGFVETDTENAQVLTPFLRSLVERGLDISQGVLVILDGGKGLRAAVRKAFRHRALVHRCQWHKRENVVSYLAKSEQASWRQRLQRAYNRPEYKEARAALETLQRELEDRNQSAAGSLAEGLDETLTLHRLGVYGVLGRSLKTTNSLESVNALVEERCAKVDHWQNSSQRHRWLATALLDIEPRLRKVMGLGAQLAISVNNCPPPRDPRSRMTSVKRTQRKYVQKAYRVRNWREYETGLRARGSLTVWLGLTDGKLANWNSPRPTRRTPSRQRQYSNHAIETTVTLGLVFGLASRQTEGFLRSLLTLLNLDNDVPDHSTISRRKARLGKVASYERRTVKPVHLLIDSSGLSVHVGQLRTPPKARDYRKLHLAVDEQTSDVVACELTSKRARDASRVASLVGQIERPIASAKADAAYDTGDV